MKRVVVLCQAPAHVKYTLQVYDNLPPDGEAHIFAINVEGMRDFLTGCGLKRARVDFIPYPREFVSIRHVATNVRLRKSVRALIRKYFQDVSGTTVYYFSNREDWITGAMVAGLASTNRVVCLDNEERFPSKRRVTLREQLMLASYRWVTGAEFELTELPQTTAFRGILRFRAERYGVETQSATVDDAILRRYAFPVDADRARAILLFEGSLRIGIIDYEDRVGEILQGLVDRGWRIFIKPHPRLGCSDVVSRHKVTILPAHVPSEFIDPESFGAVVGTVSTALMEAAVRCRGKNVFTLVNVFRWQNEQDKNSYHEIVQRRSGGLVQFAASVDDLLARIGTVGAHAT
ncbi:MAG: hypothetical protein JXB04_06200 [Kiritimatiellae bacterium]|nr:hypothetical protein [Kiritimatiellia bacterium]